MVSGGTLAALKSAVLDEKKPHSSVTDLIEIFTAEKYPENTSDGLFELVQSIGWMGDAGPYEASRALRKKLKYGSTHRQIRALTLIHGLLSNGVGAPFPDHELVNRLKVVAGDPHTDTRVQRKLMAVLKSLQDEFKGDPSMGHVNGLYRACGGGKSADRSAYLLEQSRREAASRERLVAKEAERRRLEEQRKQKKADRAFAKSLAAKDKALKPKVKRAPFDFEKEKPNIMNAVASATQSVNNLTNALRLVNRERESVTTNARVVEHLEKTKLARKQVVRYIQRVEDEEYIGMLLSTNEAIIEALQLYDKLSRPATLDSEDEDLSSARVRAADGSEKVDVDALRVQMGATHLGPTEGELEKLQDRQRIEIERSQRRAGGAGGGGGGVYEDLAELEFGSGAGPSSSLPPPIRPDADRATPYTAAGGSLSDYSDYDSSDEEYRAAHSHTYHQPSTSSTPAPTPPYGRLQEDEDEGGLLDEDDPFADPVEEVGTPGIVEKKRNEWAEI